MKKVIALLLIFIAACGPSDDEIKAQIDEAVEDALTEVTTASTTTTTLQDTTTTTVQDTTTTTVQDTTTTTSTTIPLAKETGVGFDDEGIPIPIILTSFEKLVNEISPESLQSDKPIYKFTYKNGTYENNLIVLHFLQQDDSRICRTSFVENKSNEYFVTCNEDFSSSAPELSIRNSLNGNLRLKYITITDSEKPGCNLMVTVEQESFLYNLSCFSLDNPGNPFKGEDYGDPKEDLFKYIDLQLRREGKSLSLNFEK